MRGVFISSLLLFSITLSFGQSRKANHWYDFETTSTLPKFTTFQTDFEVFENPNRSNVNPSLLVGRVTKIPGKSIGYSGILINPPGKMDISNGAFLKMKVFATTKGGTIQVKIETEPKSIHSYSTLKIDKLNQWQELTFPFTKGQVDVFTKLVIIFDYGSVEDHVFYFDDLVWVEGGADSEME